MNLAQIWLKYHIKIITLRLWGGVSVVVDLLLIVTPIVGVCNCSMFCCTLPYVNSSFAIILIGKRELVALLRLSSWCLVIVVWLFLALPCVCLQVMIVVFFWSYSFTIFITYSSPDAPVILRAHFLTRHEILRWWKITYITTSISHTLGP